MRRILDNIISLAVVVIVLFLIIPLPTQLLDLLLVVNIGLSVMILMITMNISEALEFSTPASLTSRRPRGGATKSKRKPTSTAPWTAPPKS